VTCDWEEEVALFLQYYPGKSWDKIPDYFKQQFECELARYQWTYDSDFIERGIQEALSQLIKMITLH
jgi:hypothetical protein